MDQPAANNTDSTHVGLAQQDDVAAVVDAVEKQPAPNTASICCIWDFLPLDTRPVLHMHMRPLVGTEDLTTIHPVAFLLAARCRRRPDTPVG